MSRKVGKYCHIRCQETGYVLEVQGKKLGSHVVTSVSRDEEHGNENQLWYVDSNTQTIRSKVKDYCLDYNHKDDTVVVRQFAASRSAQKWVIVDGLIQTQDDFEIVVGAQEEIGSPVRIVENGEGYIKWNFESRPAQFFFVRSRKVKHKVLDVEKAKEAPGTKVIVWHDKGTTADNQLWYEDQKGILRSKLTDFVIDASGKEVVFNPYNAKKEMQQWILKDNVIRNWHHPTKVIALQQGRIPVIFYDTVTVQKYTGSENQLWDIKYLPHSVGMFNHGGLGKYFFIKCFWEYVVLSLQTRNKSPGTPIITAHHKQRSEDCTDQLFYVDDVTQTIRDKENDYCLEISDGVLVTNLYNPGAENQQWEINGRKLQNKVNTSTVLTVQMEATYANAEDDTDDILDCNVTSSPDNDDATQQFEFEHVPAGSFFIRNQNSGRLIDVNKAERSIGAKVIQWEQKPTVCENQLWYEDERGIIRSKMTGYVIEANGSTSKMMPYDQHNKAQHWVIVGDRIQNKHDPGLVLDVKYQSKWNWIAIVSSTFDGSESQKWKIEPV